MKKIFASVFIITSILSACCCHKSKTCNNGVCSSADNPEGIAQALPGDWIWFKTNCCGRAMQTRTPESEKYQLRLHFSADQKVEYFKNETSEGAHTYSVAWFDEGGKKVGLSIDKRPALVTLKNDTLVVDYGYMDLQTEYYVRKK